jgi:hypothetical protein
MWVIHTGGLRADVGLITQHDIESDTVSDECCGGTKKINTFHSDTRFPWWNIIHPIVLLASLRRIYGGGFIFLITGTTNVGYLLDKVNVLPNQRD